MTNLKLKVDDKVFEVKIDRGEPGNYLVSVNGRKFNTSIIQPQALESTLIAVEGSVYDIALNPKSSSKMWHAKVNDRERTIETGVLLGANTLATSPKVISKSIVEERPIQFEKKPALGSTINAPMPGKVVSINVKESDAIKAGDVVLILEAMKMENEIISPKDGNVAEVRVSEGDSVDGGDVLVVIS